MKVLLDVGVSHRLRLLLQDALGGMPVESAIFRHIGVNSGTTNSSHAPTRRDSPPWSTTDKRLATEQPVLPLAVIAVDDNRLPALVAAVDDIANAIRGVDIGEHRIVAINA